MKFLSDEQLVRLYERINREFLRVHEWLTAVRAEVQKRGLDHV